MYDQVRAWFHLLVHRDLNPLGYVFVVFSLPLIENSRGIKNCFVAIAFLIVPTLFFGIVHAQSSVAQQLSQAWPAELPMSADDLKKMYLNEKRRIKTKANKGERIKRFGREKDSLRTFCSRQTKRDQNMQYPKTYGTGHCRWSRLCYGGRHLLAFSMQSQYGRRNGVLAHQKS